MSKEPESAPDGRTWGEILGGYSNQKDEGMPQSPAPQRICGCEESTALRGELEAARQQYMALWKDRDQIEIRHAETVKSLVAEVARLKEALQMLMEVSRGNNTDEIEFARAVLAGDAKEGEK